MFVRSMYTNNSPFSPVLCSASYGFQNFKVRRDLKNNFVQIPPFKDEESKMQRG